MKKYVAILLCMVMVLGLLGACAPAAKPGPEASAPPASKTDAPVDEKDLPVLRLGSFDTRAGFVTWYMTEHKMDVENGFKLQLEVSSTGGAFLNEAIGAGLLDATIMGAPQGVFSAYTYGCKTVAELGESNGSISLMVAADSDMTKAGGENDVFGNPETVKGKSFMYPVGSMAQIAVIAYLDKLGLTLEDIEVVNMQQGPAYQALQSGDGDVAVLFSPLDYTALSDGYARLACMNQLGVSSRDMLMVTPETYEDAAKMDIIAKYLKVFYEIADMFAADVDFEVTELQKYYTAMGKTVPNPEEMLKMEAINNPLMTSEKALADAEKMADSCVKIAEFYVEYGTVEEPAIQSVKDSVDNSIVKKALGK